MDSDKIFCQICILIFVAKLLNKKVSTSQNKWQRCTISKLFLDRLVQEVGTNYCFLPGTINPRGSLDPRGAETSIRLRRVTARSLTGGPKCFREGG